MKLLHVSPHPDDEAIAVGLLLYSCVRHGHEVVNLLLSLGRPEDHDRRRGEAIEAAARGGWNLRSVDPPLKLSSRDAEPATAIDVKNVILGALRGSPYDVVLGPSPSDGHPGHELVGNAVALALEELEAKPRWWMWSLWADLPQPTLFCAFDESTMDGALHVLDAYAGENQRNDYRRLVIGRAMANTVIGSERIFGFGSPTASDQPYAELLTELVYRKNWQRGPGRILRLDQPLDLSART